MDKEQRRKAIIELARKIHEREGALEIDDNAKVSEDDELDDNGCYVQAWIWMDLEGTGLGNEKREP